MTKTKREELGEGALRIASIIEHHKVRSLEAYAVMAAHNLKPSDRMEPGRFLRLAEEWRSAPAGGR